MSNIENWFLHRSKKIIDFKKSSLRIPNTPIKLIGNVDVSELASYIQKIPMIAGFPGKSPGFNSMSEYITKNDLEIVSLYKISPVTQKLDELIAPIAESAKTAVENIINQKTMIARGVIDTIDKNSCIIPHCDGFVFHKYSFRTHVPLFNTEKSLGMNFDPWTLKHYAWKMNTIGGIYLFNNFEPHTAAMLDTGFRSHLIFDVTVENLLVDFEQGYGEAKKYLASRGERTTETFSPNTITHSLSNYTIRNNLNKMYGNISPKENLLAQATPEAIGEAKIWIDELLNFELDNGNVIAI